MIKKTLLLILSICFFCCENSNKKKETTKEKPNISNYESSLLDYRPINKHFTENYKVTDFGIDKQNDSIIDFVFKVDNEVTNSTVEAYSLGIRVFDKTLDKPLNLSFNPTLQTIDNKSYIVLRKKIKQMKYFDSIDVYIFKRKDWKGSGRIGGYIIRDILFE